MAIGTPTIVCAPAVYVTNLTTASIVSGNLVVVAVCLAGNGRFCTGVSDGTNTYTEGPHLLGGASLWSDTSLWYKQNAAAVAAGATYTFTASGGAPVSNICAAQVSGVATTSAFDSAGVGASNPAQGTSQSPTVTTGTLSQADEILFGVTGSSVYQATYTEDANFTNLGAISFLGHAGSVSLGYELVSSTSAVTFAPSLGTSANWIALVAPFKAAATGFNRSYGTIVGI